MNSSIAASMIAPRRSAARSARLEAGFGGGLDPAEALAALRRPAGLAADFREVLAASLVMVHL
jgi:hypothetical protein